MKKTLTDWANEDAGRVRAIQAGTALSAIPTDDLPRLAMRAGGMGLTSIRSDLVRELKLRLAPVIARVHAEDAARQSLKHKGG